MPRTPTGTIELDQPLPVKEGDTVTFTTTGDRAKYINIGIYGIHSGLMWARTLVPVGTPIELGAAGEAYVWLDNDRDMAWSMATIRFMVDEA